MRLTIRFATFAAALPFALAQPQISSDLLEQLRYRYIGPVGNRVIAAASVPGDPNVYYAGAASGGIFKTTDGGTHWEPIFDREAGLLGRIAGDRSERSQHRLGGHRRDLHPQPHLSWTGHLQIARRGKIVAHDGSRKDRPHRARAHRPA